MWESEDKTSVTSLEEIKSERVEVVSTAEVAVRVREVTGGRDRMVEVVVVVGEEEEKVGKLVARARSQDVVEVMTIAASVREEGETC